MSISAPPSSTRFRLPFNPSFGTVSLSMQCYAPLPTCTRPRDMAPSTFVTSTPTRSGGLSGWVANALIRKVYQGHSRSPKMSTTRIQHPPTTTTTVHALSIPKHCDNAVIRQYGRLHVCMYPKATNTAHMHTKLMSRRRTSPSRSSRTPPPRNLAQPNPSRPPRLAHAVNQATAAARPPPTPTPAPAPTILPVWALSQ